MLKELFLPLLILFYCIPKIEKGTNVNLLVNVSYSDIRKDNKLRELKVAPKHLNVQGKCNYGIDILDTNGRMGMRLSPLINLFVAVLMDEVPKIRYPYMAATHSEKENYEKFRGLYTG